MTTAKLNSIWTPTFALLCLAQFLGYAQQFMLNPTFPLYITQLGGTPFVIGLVLFWFAATSVIFRPIVGYWADRWSEAGMLNSGLVVLAASVLLCFFPFVGALMVANALRGIGWAGLNTGGYALLARIAPQARRGEAAGYYSGVQSSATILFPAVALWLIDAPLGGFNTVFGSATVLAMIAAGVGVIMARRMPRSARRATDEPATAWWRELVNLLERDVLLPSSLLLCLQFSLPAVTSFIVLYAREIGVGAIGSYFVVGGITSMVARPLLGRVSDKIGPGYSLLAAYALQSGALCLLVMVSSLGGILISGVLYMLGAAIGGSSTLTLAMQRANPARRGRAMATFSVAFPLGYGTGALLTGSAVGIVGYFWSYLILAGLCACGLVVTLMNWSNLKS